MSAKNVKIVLVVGAIALFVLLFNLPKVQAKHSADDGHNHNSTEKATNVNLSANLQVYLNQAQKVLSPEKKSASDQFLLKKNYDSLVTFWNQAKRPDLAAFFSEEKAKLLNVGANWADAGNRYYYATQFVQDNSEVPVLYASAMRCFKKTLALEPKNVDAKIMLGACYVEGSPNPMDGIGILREVEKTDSNNVKLQLNFAFFSVKSGQMDRAISRFNKVLKIDSTYIEAWLHLADAYEQQSKTELAINALQQYSLKTNDITARTEVNKYIEQLKSKQ
jgi:tetratricopeptide (TPR) repeat protein